MKNKLIISAVFSPEPVVSAKLSEDIAVELALTNTVTVLAPKPTRPFGFTNQNSQKLNSGFVLINLDSYTCPESNLFGRFRESYSFGIACRKFISKNNKDIDLIYMNSWPIFSQYIIAKTAEKYNISLITHVQDIYPESLSNKLPKLKAILNFVFLSMDKYVLNNSSKIIAISKEMKGYLAKTRGLNKDKIEVVLNWQNEESFLEYKRINGKSKKSNSFVFMFLGNIGPVAGVDSIIKAFIKAKIEGSKLIIAGSGSKKIELQKFVKVSKVTNIEFLDVPDGKVPEFQSLSDVMLLPIKKGAASSSIPSKLPAYMFSKKPILASVDSDSETSRVILEAKCGWVVEPEDIDVLKDKLIEVFNLNTKELHEKGVSGYNYAMNFLSKRHSLSKIINLINQPQ